MSTRKKYATMNRKRRRMRTMTTTTCATADYTTCMIWCEIAKHKCAAKIIIRNLFGDETLIIILFWFVWYLYKGCQDAKTMGMRDHKVVYYYCYHHMFESDYNKKIRKIQKCTVTCIQLNPYWKILRRIRISIYTE